MTGILTAGPGSGWESELVIALGAPGSADQVVRRCVDLADLLTEAGLGTASVALISADLRHLDGDAIGRLRDAGLSVIVVHGERDESGRFLQMGADLAVEEGRGATAILDVVDRADKLHRSIGQPAWSDPRAALRRLPTADPPGPAGTDGRGGRGSVLAVWGPTGAPGRSTLASGIAVAASRRGRSSLLVDADVYGGVLSSAFGLLEESPGLAGVCRTAGQGRLTVDELARATWSVGPQLRLLTGIARADRWTEVRPSALPAVFDVARSFAGITVVDCGFCLEADEELSFDTSAPRRNGATLAVLEAADLVLAVGSADPPGMERLIRGLGQLRELVPVSSIRVVLNRVRRTAAAGDDAAQALHRFTGLTVADTVPEDRATLDKAWQSGVPAASVAAKSALAKAFDAVAGRLLGELVPTPTVTR